MAGTQLNNGNLWETDLSGEAAELMRRADGGDAEAQYAFATYLLREFNSVRREDLIPEEVERALRYLRLSAAQGHFHGIAAMELGEVYHRGEIVPRDYKKAKLWYETALLRGNPPAAYMLGEYAYCGYDCAVDYETAAKYYLQAAGNFIDAVVRLGDMYLHGEYFVADPVFAAELYAYVLEDEERLFQQCGFYSDMYDQVHQRLDELERNGDAYTRGLAKETEAQAAMRRKLLKITSEFSFGNQPKDEEDVDEALDFDEEFYENDF
jgi:TPR repeat protein